MLHIHVLHGLQRSTKAPANACLRCIRHIVTCKSHVASASINTNVSTSANIHRLGRLVLVRHGESYWNITDHSQGISPRFSGWADVPLTPLGIKQAIEAGKCLHEHNFQFDVILTSVLSRSMQSSDILIKEMTNQPQTVPVIHSWRLNERHYGSLVGQSKKNTPAIASKYGVSVEAVWSWRRSWTGKPPAMSEEHALERSHESHLQGREEVGEAAAGEPDPNTVKQHNYIGSDESAEIINYPGYVHRATVITRLPHSIKPDNASASACSSVPFYLNSQKYSSVRSVESTARLPLAESLEDTAMRVSPLWHSHVLPRIGRYMYVSISVRVYVVVCG